MSESKWKHINGYRNEVIEGRAIMDIWTVDDVIDRAKDLDMEIPEEEAIDILQQVNENKDACIGINWDVLDRFIMEWSIG
jgi:hypothetical protein